MAKLSARLKALAYLAANEQRTLLFTKQATDAGFPALVPEYKFAFPPRRWRFDFAFPSLRLALEVEGGSWIAGHHTRGKGFTDDLEKYNTAAVLGWTVIRATPQQVDDGTALTWLLRVNAARSLGI